MANDARTIEEVCGACGRANRLPLARLNQRALCGACRQPLRAAGAPVQVNEQQLDALLRGAIVPVVVDFWADWCGPCRALAPVLDQVARRLPTQLIVAKLNVDENPGAAQRYGARAIPLILMFVRGQPTWRATGLRSAPQLESELRRALAASHGGDHDPRAASVRP